jgi:hypothetical protein
MMAVVTYALNAFNFMPIYTYKDTCIYLNTYTHVLHEKHGERVNENATHTTLLLHHHHHHPHHHHHLIIRVHKEQQQQF